ESFSFFFLSLDKAQASPARTPRRHLARSKSLPDRGCRTLGVAIGMSAMGQKRKSSARQSSKDLSEASPIVSSKPFDLIVGQPRGDQLHAAIDVIATLPRRIELELLNEIFVALLCEHRRFDRAAGTGPMTG